MVSRRPVSKSVRFGSLRLSLPEIGIDLPRRGDVGVAAGPVARLLFRQAADVVRDRIVRRELDGLGLVLDGAVVEAFVVIGEAAVGIGVGLVRIERDGAVEIGDGVVVAAGLAIIAAAIAIG